MHLGTKGLVLAGLFASSFTLSAAEPSIQGMRFGDWGGVCDAQVCYIQQVVSQNDTPVMVTAIGYAPNKPTPTVLFELPVTVNVKAGLYLQVDNNEPVKFTGNCDKSACHAGFALDDSLMQQFRRGHRAAVTFTPKKSKKTATLPLSLNGLNKGLTALQP